MELACIVIASACGHEQCVKALLRAGAKPNNYPDTENLLPLSVTAEMGYYRIVVLLLNAGADIHATALSEPHFRKHNLGVIYKLYSYCSMRMLNVHVAVDK